MAAKKKSPRKKLDAALDAALSTDPLEKLHSAGEAGLRNPALAAVNPPLPLVDGEINPRFLRDTPFMQSVQREPPSDEQADAASSEVPEPSLASRVRAALRFTDKDTPYVWLTQTSVIGSGRSGTVYATLTTPMPHLPPEGLVVDGKRLYRALRLLGDGAKIEKDSSGRLQLSTKGRRFHLAVLPALPVTPLPVPPDAQWSVVFPAAFARVVPFLATDGVELHASTGVHIAATSCYAFNGHAAGRASGFSEQALKPVSLPRNTFADVVGDAHGRVFYAVTANGHVAIGDPATGEYRVVTALGDGNPNVGELFNRYTPAFALDVNKDELLSAIRDVRVVQAETSSVKLWIWVDASGAHYLEMRGGDGDGTAESVVRLECKIQPSTGGVPTGLAGGTGMFKIVLALKYLRFLVEAHPGEMVRLSFGESDITPVSVWHASFAGIAAPMRA